MPDLRKALKDFVATSNSGKYKTEEELMSKFPELNGYDRKALKDYVATSNSGKYKSDDEILSKFPEFQEEGKKSQPATVKSGGLISSEPSDEEIYQQINKRGSKGDTEDPREKILRFKEQKVIADAPVKVLDSKLRAKHQSTTNKFNEEFRPEVTRIRKLVSEQDNYDPEMIKVDLGLGDEYDEQIFKAISDRKEDLSYLNDNTPYAQFSKKQMVDDGKGNTVEVDADNFVDKYFGKEKLSALGIDPKDFDGFLEINKKKEGFSQMADKGFFTEGGTTDFLGMSSNHKADLAYDLQRLNLINEYFDDNMSKQRSLAADYLKKAAGGNIEARSQYEEVAKNIIEKTTNYQKFIKENLPAYSSKESERNAELKSQYKKYKEGHADEFLNWGRGAWEGVAQSVHGIAATTYDLLGAEDTATQIRLQKEQEARYTSTPDLYYITEQGMAVNHKGTNYLVTSDGEIIDTDDKLKATGLLDSEDYNSIMSKSKISGKFETTNSFGGAVQQSSGVIGDMAMQILLTKGVSGSTSAIGATVKAAGRTVKNSEILFAAENALGRTTIGKSLYSRAAGKAMEAEVLNIAPLATRLTKIPAVYGDVLITQGAYGYSNGYETAYSAMIKAGKTDEQAREIAEEAGTQMATLYGATAFIAPQTNILNALESSSIKSLINKGIASIEREGVEGFSKTMSQGVKGMLKDVSSLRNNSIKEVGEKVLTSNVAKGAITAVEEAGKEVVQENIQQFGENTIVNANINDLAGEDLLKETYTMQDFKNTTALAFSSALMLNSPSMLRGTDKMSVLSQLANHKDNFENSLKDFVNRGLTTTEKAEGLKSEVETFRRYRNMIPTETSNNVAFEVMKKLQSIDNIQTQMDAVHGVLKDTYKERIEKEKVELQEMIQSGKTNISDSKYLPEDVKPTEVRESKPLNDSGVITERDVKWDEDSKAALPDSDFQSEEEFKAVLTEGKWGMLTAENPNAKQASDDTNFNRNEEAVSWLEERGYKAQPIFGKYDNSENSFFVEDLSVKDAKDFAIEFNQESVATDEGLVYQDGTMNPRIKGEESFETKDNYYSSVKVGDKLVDYSVEYDFKTKVEPTQNEETETVAEIEKLDLSSEIGINRTIELLEGAKGKIEQFGKTNMSSMIIPTPVLTAAIDAMIIAAKASKLVADITSAGINEVMKTSWYKGLTKDAKSQFHKDGLLNIISKSEEQIRKESPTRTSKLKSTIRKNTGQTDTSKKVMTTEKKLLKLKLKTMEQAQRVERAFASKNRTLAVANMKALVETLSKNGTVSPAVLKAMLRGALNLDASNPEKVKKYMERVKKVISKINDRASMVQARKLSRDVNRLPKATPVNIVELGKVAAKINERYLSPKSVKKYIEAMTRIKQSTLPVLGGKQVMVDVDSVYNTLETLQSEVEANQLQEVKDSLSMMGIDLTNLNMSDSEIQEFWDSEVDVNVTTLEEKKQKSLDKAKAIREELKGLADIYKAAFHSWFDLSNMKTARTKDVAKTLGQANTEYMDSNSLKEYIKAVQNLLTNDNVTGAGKIASEIKATNGMLTFVTNVVNSGIPLGKIKMTSKIQKDGNFINDLKSLSLLMKEVYKSPILMGEFNYFSGLADYSKGRVKVDRMVDAATKGLDELFKVVSKNNKDIRSSENTLLRGVVANLIQGSTKEELEINKARMEDHISKADKHVEEIQKVYDMFKGFESQWDILDHLYHMDDGNFEIIQYWMDKFADMKDDLKENTEVTHNELFNEVSAHYLPIKIKRDISLDLDEGKSSIYNYGGVSAPRQSAMTIKRNNSKKLPEKGLLDLDFDAAMVNRYKMGMTDIHTASSLQQVKSFLGSKQIKGLMGKSNVEVFSKRINYMQKLTSGLLNESTDTERAVSSVERILKKIGIVSALGGVTAIVKQTVPVMSQVAIQVGTKNFGRFIRNFSASQNNSLLEDFSTSMRGDSTLGTKNIADSAEDLRRYEGLSGGVSNAVRKSGRFFSKTQDAFMKPLQAGDAAVAKAAWTTYYLEYLSKHGYDASSIDLSEEHNFIAEDEMRQRAASYAEVRIEETQVSSDNQRSASLFNNTHIGISALRTIFLPFQQFNINSKMRMVLDISEIMNTRKNGKLAKQVSQLSTAQLIEKTMSGELLANAHATKGGKNDSLKKSIKSLSATMVEQAMFQGMKAYALTLLTSNTAALFSFLIDDEDDTDRHQEWLDKEIDWGFKTKQFYSNLVKDLNPLLIGNFAEDLQIDALNRFHYLFGEDSEDFETYYQWEKNYKKENGALPFYKYDNKGKGMYGIYSIPVEIGEKVLENADLAYDGEMYKVNNWGKEEKFELSNDSQLRFMRVMFIMEVLRGTTGVEADSYRELEKVRKELVKGSKVKNSK